MNKDSAVVLSLAELGLLSDQELSPEQEEMLKRALDSEEQFLYDVENLFSEDPTSK